MNRMISVMLLMLLSLVGVSQPKDNSQIVRINNTLYKIEGKDTFEINQNIITVKPHDLDFFKKKDFSVVRSNVLGNYDISVPEGEKVENYYYKLQQSGLFDIVKYNTYYPYSIVPNDEYVGFQWYLDTINVYNAWNITMGSPSVKIAVLDSGVDVTHEDVGYGNDTYSNIDLLYGNNIMPVYYHGTAVAGIIGAKTNNSVGIAGIAGGNNSLGATIYSYYLGAYQADGSIVDDAILDAVDDGVNIIQLTIDGAYDQDIIDAIDYAYNNNVTVVCSSGNDSSSNPTCDIRYPACYEKVIAVGASDYSNHRAAFSRYGSGLDFVAPGIDIICTTFSLPYYSYSGTSYSSPQVSGIIALMLSVNSQLTPSMIKDILRGTAKKDNYYQYVNGWNEEVGYGLVDAYAAVDMAQYYIDGTDTLCTTNVYTATGLPSGATVQWTLSGSNASKFNLVQNSPSTGQCTITKKANAVFSSPTFTLTLTANIYQGSTLLKTKTKTLTCDNGFACTYWQDAHSYYGVNYPAITQTQMTSATNYVYPGGIVYLQSDYFRGKLISTSGIFDNFQHAGQNIVRFSLPPYTSSPAYINVAAKGCDEAIQLTFYPMSYYSKSGYSVQVMPADGQAYRVSLIRNEDEAATEDMADNDRSDNDVAWTIEVVNALTGRKVFATEPDDTDYLLSTARWGEGIYVLRVLVEGEPIFAEKIHVK